MFAVDRSVRLRALVCPRLRGGEGTRIKITSTIALTRRIITATEYPAIWSRARGSLSTGFVHSGDELHRCFSAGQRQRMVISRPVTIKVKPIRKFQLPRLLSSGILSMAR